jgi:transcriptional regulator with XRE-family HTH domain
MNISSQKIKFLRSENGWSQEKLSEASGISLRTIQRIEAKGECSAETQMMLALSFNVSPAELLEEHNNQIGSGSISYGSILGLAILSLLIITTLAWEWRDLSVFINIWTLLYVVSSTIALSLLSSGLHSTIRGLFCIGWFIREPLGIKNAQSHLPVFRRIIIYAYASGAIWSLVDIVEASYFSLKNQDNSTFTFEIGFSLLALLYGVIIAEFIIRPLKNKIEHLLSINLKH